jgi:hypothetical protein
MTRDIVVVDLEFVDAERIAGMFTPQFSCDTRSLQQ